MHKPDPVPTRQIALNMLHLIALAGSAHAPTYVGGTENCYTPPRHHTTSQVIYLKGSGGIELHITSPTTPFDIPGNEEIDFDAVFKKKYDQSTYSLYVGCGGCVASQDPIVIPPVVLDGYEHGELEPFTQTAYFSVFPKALRKFNASDLDGCSENHFTIRLLDYANRTNGEELVWGAVIGLGERFTFVELLEFPIYVLNNHGPTWNDMWWTAPISFIFLAPLFMWWTRLALKAAGQPVVELDIYVNVRLGRPYIMGRWAAREWLYEIALIGFAGAMIEMFIHLCYAQSYVPMGYGFWVGLIAVIGFANGLPIYQVITAWGALKLESRDKTPRCCDASYWRCSASPWWAPFEILFGFSYFLLFGAGFFLGPSAIMVAGMLRMLELTRVLDAKRLYGSEAHTERPPLSDQERDALMRGEKYQRRGGSNDAIYPSLFF